MTAVPKSAKKPQDRKPKAQPDPEPVESDEPEPEAEAELGQPRVVTVNGREWTVPAEALDDFELLDDLGEVAEGTVDRMPSLLRRMLGPEQAKVALNTLRDPDTGRVTMAAGTGFVGELLVALNPN